MIHCSVFCILDLAGYKFSCLVCFDWTPSQHDPAYVQGGVKAIVGNYTRGRLEGQAKMVMVDDTCRHCWVQGGWLHGPCRF